MNLVIYKIQAPIREIWNTWLFLIAKTSRQSFYWGNHISYTERWWAKKSSKISFSCYEKTVSYIVSPKQKGAFFIFSTHAHSPIIHVCVYPHSYIYVCVCVCVYIYIYILVQTFLNVQTADCQYLFSVDPQGFIYLNTEPQNERLHPPVYLVTKSCPFTMLWPME